MHKFHVQADAALQPFIDRLWGWESAPGEEVALPTLLPGTGAELYFHYGAPFRHLREAGAPLLCDAAHLLCLRRQPLPLCPGSDVGFIAVRFRAGMLPRFCDLPGREVHDRVLAVDDLWGRAGRALARRVAEAGSMAERLRLIQDFLQQRLRGESADALVEEAVALLYRESAAISIEQLAARLKIGRRQLERRFQAQTGQSPAEFRRLGRFQKTVRSLLLAPEALPLAAALAEGYYDQAHFCRDFSALACAAPGRFLAAARAKTHFYNTPRAPSEKMTTLSHP